jgi:hypothetical protein
MPQLSLESLQQQLLAMKQDYTKLLEIQNRLREIIARYESPPWRMATFIRQEHTPHGERALVAYGGEDRAIAVSPEVDITQVPVGTCVFLSKEGNVLMGLSSVDSPRGGEIGTFERFLADGRLGLKYRDEDVIVDAAAPLQQVPLQAGDLVRWDRVLWMAFERVEPAAKRGYFLDIVPDVSRHRLGGLDNHVETLLSALYPTLVAPAKARKYGLDGRGTILLVGPPGCGKTLSARVAAAEVSRSSGKPVRFSVVKPAEWESPWVGETQHNIRRAFQAWRDSVEREHGMVVVFLDEVEAIGRTRGHVVGYHQDKFLAALLTELDGFQGREGIAIISATNRKDLIDPALLERLSDIEIQIPRPTMSAARAILGVHLPDSLPYSEPRDELIETAVSQWYAPNGQNTLCTLRFRDGKTRTVSAHELASGRAFEQICRTVRRAAFLRDLQGDAPGLRRIDIEHAVSQAMERLATTLTRNNVHTYLADLPQDVDVVSVDPIVRKVNRPQRYLNVA